MIRFFRSREVSSGSGWPRRQTPKGWAQARRIDGNARVVEFNCFLRLVSRDEGPIPFFSALNIGNRGCLEHRTSPSRRHGPSGDGHRDTDREFSANFDRQASATNSVSFLGLSPPKASKTVSFFVSFHRGATQSGILFLVSIERGTSRRVYHRRPWLSDMSQLGGAPCRFLARPAVARVGVSDRCARNGPYRVTLRSGCMRVGLSARVD